jgi:hypothetical protein
MYFVQLRIALPRDGASVTAEGNRIDANVNHNFTDRRLDRHRMPMVAHADDAVARCDDRFADGINGKTDANQPRSEGRIGHIRERDHPTVQRGANHDRLD